MTPRTGQGGDTGFWIASRQGPWNRQQDRRLPAHRGRQGYILPILRRPGFFRILLVLVSWLISPVEELKLSFGNTLSAYSYTLYRFINLTLIFSIYLLFVFTCIRVLQVLTIYFILFLVQMLALKSPKNISSVQLRQQKWGLGHGWLRLFQRSWWSLWHHWLWRS